MAAVVAVAVAVTVVMVVDQRGTAARVPRTMSVYRRIMQINLVATAHFEFFY
jgi:hypothetical protein